MLDKLQDNYVYVSIFYLGARAYIHGARKVNDKYRLLITYDKDKAFCFTEGKDKRMLDILKTAPCGAMDIV